MKTPRYICSMYLEVPIGYRVKRASSSIFNIQERKIIRQLLMYSVLDFEEVRRDRHRSLTRIFSVTSTTVIANKTIFKRSNIPYTSSVFIILIFRIILFLMCQICFKRFRRFFNFKRNFQWQPPFDLKTFYFVTNLQKLNIQG